MGNRPYALFMCKCGQWGEMAYSGVSLCTVGCIGLLCGTKAYSGVYWCALGCNGLVCGIMAYYGV